MQQLPDTTKEQNVVHAAQALLDVALPVNWFVRRHMRGLRQGLSVPQFRALVFVDTQPDKSLSDMAEFIGSSVPTASRLISGLVRRNLVRRQGCTHDRRQVALALTCRGQSVLRTAWTGIQQRVAEELSGLTPSQCQVIVIAMDSLRGIFGEVGFNRSNSSPAPPRSGRIAPLAREGIRPLRDGVARSNGVSS
jgi:DNA-binding MarR family transcriptional regulator